MHYRMLVTINRDVAKTSEEARQYVSNFLDQDVSFVGGGRFGGGHADWFVVGGRWSGELSRATWVREVQAEAEKLEAEEKVRLRGFSYPDVEKAARQARLTEKVEALYAEAMPEAYQGRGLSYVRDRYVDPGYEDDAMIVSGELYDALLAGREGHDLVTDGVVVDFVDLDYEPLSRDFIGHKWLVVVDAHI